MKRLSTLALSAAAFAMTATPAAALDLPAYAAGPVKVETGAPGDAAGWRRGRHHRGGGIDAGDVIAGVLVLGGIAAIASAASNADRREREREQVRYDTRQEARQRDLRADYSQSRGIDRAVDMCIDQLERGRERVESVDNASRVADGWRVSGELDDGAAWNCWIDNDGRIREVDFGSRYSFEDDNRILSSAGDPQWSDEAYARARAAIRADTGLRDEADAIDADLANQPRPAYPGGPLPGEEGYEEALAAG